STWERQEPSAPGVRIQVVKMLNRESKRGNSLLVITERSGALPLLEKSVKAKRVAFARAYPDATYTPYVAAQICGIAALSYDCTASLGGKPHKIRAWHFFHNGNFVTVRMTAEVNDFDVWATEARAAVESIQLLHSR